MSVVIEPLILYLILFLPGTLTGGVYPEVIPFSINQEMIRLLVYKIPAMGLIWYLLYRGPLGTKNIRDRGILRFCLADLITLLICLPGLILLGFGISALSSWIAPLFPRAVFLPPPPRVEAPGSPLGWLVMVISCLGTGYLEEGYFRLYLLQRLVMAGISRWKGVFISTLLFSFCHTYEGPWGIANAVLAGLALSYMFLRQGSLQGIALAHGGYNVFVYILESG